MATSASRISLESPSEEDSASIRSIRALIWLYVVMLLFEGAFRKWFMPGLSSPLLIVRDPVVILIYALALASGVFPFNRFITSLAGIAVLAALFGLVATQFNPKVYFFGLRTNFLHPPLIFVMARVVTPQQVIRIGRWWLILAVPMSYLILKQFEGGGESILNTTAGGTGVQLHTSGMKIRASGTFSFVSGLVSFCGMTAAFLLFSVLRRRTYPLWLQLAGAASLIVSVSTSGSRSAIAAVAAVSLVALFAVVLQPAILLRALLAMAVGGVIAATLFQAGSVKEGADVMSLRFEEAGGQRGIWPRIFGGISQPFKDILVPPFFGSGLGRGTNAGSAMATGEIDFGMGEGEWSRLFLESGPFVGLLFVLWRISLVGFLARVSMRALKADNALPIFLFGANAMTILNGQWGQPTALGFAALGGGLCLAAAKERPGTGRAKTIAPTLKDASATIRKRRGRSAYAEELHSA